MSSRRHTSVARAADTVRARIDLVCVSHDRGGLVVLLAAGQGGLHIPSAPYRPEPLIRDAVNALASTVLGRAVVWQESLGAVELDSRSDNPALTLGFVAVVPSGVVPAAGASWYNANRLPSALAMRHRTVIAAALTHLRGRMDHVPIAFRLLSAAFTLSELQSVYELLVGGRLHKASFRRALQAAGIVVPTDRWRSDGRGRPAQFYRYVARRRRSVARAVRFDQLGV